MAFADNFEETLKDFFFKKHPRQMKKIPQIISEFKGQEREVMQLLCKKYKVDPNTIEGLSGYTAPVAEEVTEEVVEDAAEEVSEETTTEDSEENKEEK